MSLGYLIGFLLNLIFHPIHKLAGYYAKQATSHVQDLEVKFEILTLLVAKDDKICDIFTGRLVDT